MTDDTVYVASSIAQDNVYHRDRDCMHLRGTIREKDLSTLTVHTPCKQCHDDATQAQPTEDECPLCGESVKFLARHIPDCPERDSVAGGAMPDA